MKKLYRKKRIHYTLIFGVILLTTGLVGIFTTSNPNYFLLLSSVFYFGAYIYLKTTPYVMIENGILSVKQPYSRRINLAEVKQISRRKAGYYSLKTDLAELTIDTQAIDEESIAVLNAELEKYKPEWD